MSSTCCTNMEYLQSMSLPYKACTYWVPLYQKGIWRKCILFNLWYAFVTSLLSVVMTSLWPVLMTFLWTVLMTSLWTLLMTFPWSVLGTSLCPLRLNALAAEVFITTLQWARRYFLQTLTCHGLSFSIFTVWHGLFSSLVLMFPALRIEASPHPHYRVSVYTLFLCREPVNSVFTLFY